MEKNNKNGKQAIASTGSNGKQSYGTQFLKKTSLTRRGDKSIYLRPEYHERLSRLVHIIGEDKIPMYAYLDNILKHHFAIFEEEIIKDYNRHIKLLF
ncbi:DUF3408 domain-containing protein [Chitinophaga sp. 22321]|nr:DUF3408 domain-containing protein [Chitinophaga hostae]